MDMVINITAKAPRTARDLLSRYHMLAARQCPRRASPPKKKRPVDHGVAGRFPHVIFSM